MFSSFFFHTLKNKKIKVCVFLFLFFTINICQAYEVISKNRNNTKQLIKQINHYFENNNSTKKKSNTADSAKKNHQHKITLFNAMQGNNADPWSDAFDFQKIAGTQVDPRTGTFTAYIKTGNLISNLDHGPNINLQINYSSNSRANPDGLGLGWSWNLTHFNPVNNQLTTSQGQNFSLQEDHSGHWWPRYHKIRDMQITGNKKTYFTITYINELKEILNHDGYEVRLEQQDGKGVTFSYIHGTHLLSMITDDLGHKIVLTRKDNCLTVTSYNSDGKPVNIYIRYSNGELKSVTLPNDKHQHEQGIYLSYSLFNLNHLLTRVVYPTGLTKNIDYDCREAMKMPLFYSNHGDALCVVTSQSVNPGMSQPPMVTRYAYDQINSNNHNYLGFNSGLDTMPGMKGDILFEAPADYTYSTSEDNGLVKIIRTYNKYHLLIDTKLFSDKTEKILAETHSFFCNTEQYDGCAHTRFEDLPVTYTLPLKIETDTWGENSGNPAVDITTQSYDHEGRIIEKTDAYGRREEIKYCPIQGDGFCPAASPKWPLNVLTESVTHYPSDEKITSSAVLPVKASYSFYQKEPNINKKGYILVLDKQILKAGNYQNTTTRQYYSDPDDYATYGLLKKLTFTEDKKPANAKSPELIREYHYSISADHKTKTSYSTFGEAGDDQRRSPSVTVSLFTHQTLQMTDASGKNITRYHYDNQGRLIQADSAVGTTFAVSKHYSYSVSPLLNQVVVTNPNGLQQKIIFDRAGRKLEKFTEAINASGKAEPDKWKLAGRVIYDVHGRVVATKAYDYRKNSLNRPKQLTTTYDYTATGRILRKHLPDGETAVKDYDDPDRCVVSYELNKKGDHSTITIVHGNVLDKPVKQILLPESAGVPLSAKQYCVTDYNRSQAKITTVTYDAWGRKVVSTDPAGRTVTIHYDDCGRVSEIIDPIGDKVQNVYNFMGKVVEKWAEPAKDDHRYLLFSAQYNMAGEPVWQAGEDGKRTSYTYTSDGKPDTITTPAGNVITYKYNVLGLPASKWLNGKLLKQMHYNSLTTQPDQVTDNTGTTLWTYSDDGKVQQLIHHAKNNISADYKITWTYDQNRNVIAMKNPSGGQTKTTYDDFGRISSVSYQMTNGKEQLLSAPTYDDFSRIIAIKYGSGMERSIEYNNYDQQKYIVDRLSGKPLSSWQYTYDVEGNITTLVHDAGDQQAVLNYHYDKLDNLTSVVCTGSAGLSLCPRDTHFKGSGLDKAPVITRQDYTFNGLNRMTEVTEVLIDTTQQKTLNKVISYGYGDAQAPLRLQQISTQWNNDIPVVNHFSYDVTGNIITDGDGNQMTYNAFNQITHVTTPDGKQSQYVYDGSEREVKQVINTNDTRYMFYIGKSLVGEKTDNLQQNEHSITLLSVAKAIDGVIHEYYEKNYKSDVTSVLTQLNDKNSLWTVSQRNVYSPYGMQWHSKIKNASQPLYLLTLTGFDGEQHDPVTGWQFLGTGHRTYNPGGRYFVSEDAAGDGYAFGSNNPIMHTDPSGNMPRWLGSVMGVMKYAGTLGMAALHKKWANAVGTALMVTLATISIGAGFAAGGFEPLVIAGAVGLSAAAGSVMVTAAAIPVNKGLNIASAVAGGIEMGLSIASAVASISTIAAVANALYAGITFNISFADAGVGAGEVLSATDEAAVGLEGTIQTTAAAIEGSAEVSAEASSTAAEVGTGVSGAIAAIKEAEEAAPVINATAEILRKLFPYQIEGEGDSAVFKIRSLYDIANVMTSMQKEFDLQSYPGDQLFLMLIKAGRDGQGINLNKFCAFLDAAKRLPIVDSAAQASSEYAAIIGNTQFYSSSVTGVMLRGNGVFFRNQDYVPIRIYVVKSLRGKWFAVAPSRTMLHPAQLQVWNNVDIVQLLEDAGVNPYRAKGMIFS